MGYLDSRHHLAYKGRYNTSRCVTRTLLPWLLTMAPACARLDSLEMTLPELSSPPLSAVLFTSAEVSYLTAEDATERTVGYTSFPGEGGIVPEREFDRRFSPHVLDWLVFAFMTLPSLGIPFLLWFSSSSKYDTSKAK